MKVYLITLLPVSSYGSGFHAMMLFRSRSRSGIKWVNANLRFAIFLVRKADFLRVLNENDESFLNCKEILRHDRAFQCDDCLQK